MLALWSVSLVLAPPFASEILAIRAGGLGRSVALPFVTIVGVGLPCLLHVGALRMTTVVTSGYLFVWFGWVPSYRVCLDVADIRAVELVRFQTSRDHVFWGVRRGRDGERILSARGDRGVRLTLSDGSWLVIGSQRPEELAGVLEKLVRRGL